MFPRQDTDDLEKENGASIAAKKKLPKVEENKSKKEHVNVVFIGHVGKFKVPGIQLPEYCITECATSYSS